MNMEPGYYWVRIYSEWIPAEYCATGVWHVLGYDDTEVEAAALQIGPKLKPPADL